MTKNAHQGVDHHPTDIKAQVDKIASALSTLQPKQQHRNTQLFSLLYPTIRKMLAQKVTKKAILTTLEAQGLKLHPAAFKALMDNEAKRCVDSDLGETDKENAA